MTPRVQEIVDLIGEERGRFERLAWSLSEEELSRPVPESGWQVKDFISHLATIDRPIAVWFAAIADGSQQRPTAGDTESGAGWDVDRYNDARVAERRQRSVEELLAEAADARAALISVLARFTEEHINGTICFGGDSKRPPSEVKLGRYLQGWARHDVIHVADMLKALPERRREPQVAAWLAEPEVRAVVGYYQKAMA